MENIDALFPMSRTSQDDRLLGTVFSQHVILALPYLYHLTNIYNFVFVFKPYKNNTYEDGKLFFTNLTLKMMMTSPPLGHEVKMNGKILIPLFLLAATKLDPFFGQHVLVLAIR